MTTRMKLDIGMLFAYWLSDDKGLLFDDYVEKYKSDETFEKEVNEIDCKQEYTQIKTGVIKC